ncbi:hypothetical protein [Flavobacterium sp. A45]|uniref:hypothetical protein n=1 Tax=Flavobacterium sp. A45 TaxID=1945862 RepID=UPI0009879FD4|nr:hypothetical protein [Flavobacterium sp. A45]OOG75447.1 hypothetical protein B0E44_04600 [Flavobacterium sp. A45]
MLGKFRIVFVILFLATVGCKKEKPPQKNNTFYKEVIQPNDRKTITPEEAKTYHNDTNRQYEYRTGKPGHYEYNYDVSGCNAIGDSVSGNINIQGKYGAGILTNTKGGEIEITAEWIDYGKLKAVDKAGNEYHLEVN